MRAAQDACEQIEPFTARFRDFDTDAAYAVARLIHEGRVAEGAKPVGRKIGFTNPAIWPVYGVFEPIWAHVYDTTVAYLRGSLGACRLDRFAQPRIEPEIVLHFRTAPPPGADRDAILASIDWIAHGIEIVQSHFPDWKFQAPDTIADSSLHATLLVGERRPVKKLGVDIAACLERFEIVLSCDGRVRERGRGSNVLGSPLAAAAHLIHILGKQASADPLRRGELVTTGTLTQALPIHPGEVWSTALEGIDVPGIELSFI